MTQQPTTCQQCEHAFDPHVMLTTNGEPYRGMNGLPAVQVRTEAEIARLRAIVQQRTDARDEDA